MRPPRVARLVLAVASFVAAANVTQARYVGTLNLFVGRMWLNEGEWAPVDHQKEFGLELAFAEERAPIHFSVDAFFASTDDPNPNPSVDAAVSAETTEFSVGVRKVWGENATHPHLGGGATVMQVSEDRDGPSGPITNSDRGYGAWVDVGITWRLASHLNLGLEARYSVSIVDLGTGPLLREVAAGGAQFGVLIGFGW